MKDARLKPLWVIGWCIWLLAACQPTTISQSTATIIPIVPSPVIVSPTIRLKDTPTPRATRTTELSATTISTLTPIPMLTPSVTVTPTPLPTLSSDEALATVTTLYETNNDCMLPCWWGFTPESSLWANVKATMLPVANEIYEVEDELDSSVIYGHVLLSNTYYYSGHSYLVKSGIVQAIRVEVTEPTSLFTPVSILNTYGMPEEIYLRSGQGETSYWMTFFYPKSGFRITYLVDQGTNENGVISGCFQEGFPQLRIWSPERELSFIETYALFEEEDDGEYQIPLDAAAGMDVATFYEMFRNPDVPICLETPTDIWPGY